MVQTDKALRNWKPHERGCYFDHERQLRFFRIYTAINCDAECGANFTFYKCQCNFISQPRKFFKLIMYLFSQIRLFVYK